MKNINAVIISNYKHQSENDIATFSRNYPRRNSLSNQIFSEKLNDYHSNHVCDGYVKYGMFDRDVVVASVDQLQQSIYITVARSIVNGVNTTYLRRGYSCGVGGGYTPKDCHDTYQWIHRNVKDLYLIFSGETRDCRIYASVGVIYSGYDSLYHGKPERLVH